MKGKAQKAGACLSANLANKTQKFNGTFTNKEESEEIQKNRHHCRQTKLRNSNHVFPAAALDSSGAQRKKIKNQFIQPKGAGILGFQKEI